MSTSLTTNDRGPRTTKMRAYNGHRLGNYRKIDLLALGGVWDMAILFNNYTNVDCGGLKTMGSAHMETGSLDVPLTRKY